MAEQPNPDPDPHLFADINGNRLRYRDQGEGPLVIFGHGVMGSIDEIDAQGGSALARIRERARVRLYDARGHGHSSGPEDVAAYTWESLGRDMSALIEHAGEAGAVVGGGSMGAATALWVALEQPERVRGLIALIPPPLGHPPMRGDGEKQALATLELIGHAVANFGLEKTAEMARGYPGFASTPEEADARSRWLLAQNPLALAYAIRGLLQSPYHDPERYRDIRVPALVLAHEGDGLHPARSAHLLGDTIPDCRVRIAPDPGYWWRNPDELADEVGAFLDRLG